MLRLKKSLGALAAQTFRDRALRDAALKTAAARGLSLVLLYHRVGPASTIPYEVVRTLPVDQFKRQFEILGELGEIVALPQLLEEAGPHRRVRFAVTLDDDPCLYTAARPCLHSRRRCG